VLDEKGISRGIDLHPVFTEPDEYRLVGRPYLFNHPGLEQTEYFRDSEQDMLVTFNLVVEAVKRPQAPVHKATEHSRDQDKDRAGDQCFDQGKPLVIPGPKPRWIPTPGSGYL